MKKAVICFTRVPQPGKTKTRLMSFLTGEDCAALHIAFLEDISAVLNPYDADVFVAYTPEGDHRELQRIFPYAKEFFSQKGGELGEKMHNCICHVLNMGYESCVLVGADLPLLSKEHFDSAFTALEKADVSLGPTEDGGYYLVGLKKPCATMFTNQSYSCDSVFASAVKAAESCGCVVEAALGCNDVDTADDLYALLDKLSPDSNTAKLIELLRIKSRLEERQGSAAESFPFWTYLKKDEKKRLELNCKKESIKRGHTLFDGGNDEHGILLLRSGSLRAYIVSGEGRELNLYHLKPGELCIPNPARLVPEVELDVHFEASEETQVLSLKGEDIRGVMAENSQLSHYIYKLAASRFSRTVQVLQSVLFEKLDKRLAVYLLAEAERGRGRTIVATHDTIACEIGSAREVVSKTLKQMVKNGLISLGYNRIEILDSEALKAIAGNNSI